MLCILRLPKISKYLEQIPEESEDGLLPPAT